MTWFESDLNSDTADVGLASGRKATGYALSVETGQAHCPQRELGCLLRRHSLYGRRLMPMTLKMSGRPIFRLPVASSFAARFGLAASYDSSWQGSDGRVVNTSVYGITNPIKSFSAGHASISPALISALITTAPGLVLALAAPMPGLAANISSLDKEPSTPPSTTSLTAMPSRETLVSRLSGKAPYC